MKCQTCRKELPAQRTKPAKFCSNACRQAAYRKRPQHPGPGATLRQVKLYEQLLAIHEMMLENRNAKLGEKQ